ncbi:pyridoxamine 5'-phosphate oxidase family protein [Streptomonospora nanhaiensis]|nr:PPOX class F420-dependent oxidoreductase [Streptomonospora nanhaiensis]
MSTVLYHWSPQERVVRVSATADRLKVRHLRRNPRAAVHVSAGPWAFAVAEGEAEVSAETTAPGDAVGRELLSLIPALDGPEAEAAFLAQQVAERRVVIRVRVDRLYGTALDVAEEG